VCPGGGGCGADAAGGGAGGGGGNRADGGGTDGGATSALVAAYAFDETSGTVAVDSSGRFYNAGLVGAATWAPGHAGGDVSMTGGYVIMPPGMLDEALQLTFAAWVRLRTDRIWQRIFDFGSGTGAYLFLTPHSADGTFRFAITRAGFSAEQQINATPPLPVGVWKHVVLAINGAGGTLYVDGQPVATDAVTLRPIDVAPMTNDWLGRSEFTADPNLDGELDQVRIYNRALSSAEIAALFAAP
jgi:hypothetical protein